MPQNQPVVNVNVNVSGPTGPIVVKRRTGCLLQLLYFIFIGSWLGLLAMSLAYLLFAFVITIPLGVSIINRIPYLMALREPPMVVTAWGQEVKVQQRPFLLRAIWFVIFGLVLTAAWMVVAYCLCLTFIGMPLGFWMFDRAPALLTLHKSE